MLKDFRESFAPLFNDPKFQREFLTAMNEEGGAEGVEEGLREIALAGTGTSEATDQQGMSGEYSNPIEDEDITLGDSGFVSDNGMRSGKAAGGD